jgi:transcriptional regulator with XRE-family HTH domain
MAGRAPDAVDKLVGRNIRVLRLAKGLSQTELADALGVTFQQVQKYEKGTNRVGSGRLLKISGILGVKITDFFEGTDRPHDTARRSVFDQLAQPSSIWRVPSRIRRSFSTMSVGRWRSDPMPASAKRLSPNGATASTPSRAYPILMSSSAGLG